jgi:thiamine monophosphate kinase
MVLYLRRFSPAAERSEAIGVVDMAVHPPTNESQEARATAVGDIQRATALRAAVHDCVVVLDYSGDSQSGVAVVLSAVETFDLTEEVVEQLGQ